MALDKWQLRQVKAHAQENGITEGEALAELFPEEAPARSRAKVSVTKESAKSEA